MGGGSRTNYRFSAFQTADFDTMAPLSELQKVENMSFVGEIQKSSNEQT